MLSGILERTGAAFAATTGEEASRLFFNAVEGLGATYLQTRLYRRPFGVLTSSSHWAAGGFVTRIARPGWTDSAAFRYVCFECNPLLAAIREGRTLYRFSDFAPRDDWRYRDYWDALAEANMRDVACATSYGANGIIASLHLGLADEDADPERVRAIQLAGLMLTERLMAFATPQQVAAPALTTRERESLRLVADGKTDWEISVIFGISQSTARFHIDNARRKLGAANRTHAVAKLIGQRLI